MKKLFSVVLTMFIISALILQPVYAAVYIDHDFNEGIVTESVTTTKVSDFYIFSGESYLWKTTIKNLAGNNQSYFKYVLGDDAGNATGFIMGQGKFNNPVDLTMDMRDEEGIAYPVTGDNVCIDIRIKRTGTNEAGAKLVYMDENNKVIGYLHFVGSSANPTLRAGGSVSALCDGGYAYNTWWYYRMLINFTDKTFTAFHGTSLADMQKFNAEHDSYAFSNSGAANFNKVILGMASEQLGWDSTSKGAVSIDDFRVYTLDTPTPTASDMNITGKPNIGETLTATYGTYSEPNGIAEGNSYGYWESSDDFAFTNPVKLTDNIPLKADDTSSYTLTENESNKYVRFVVVPVTVDGYEGIRGTVLPQKIDSVFATLDVIGATTGDGKNFVFVNDKNYKSYGGRVTVNNTTRYEQNLFMITAWYKDNALENAYITPVTVSAGSAEESGMKTTTATLPTGSQKTFEDADSMSGYTLRVFLFKDLDNITPVCVNRMVTEPQS